MVEVLPAYAPVDAVYVAAPEYHSVIVVLKLPSNALAAVKLVWFDDAEVALDVEAVAEVIARFGAGVALPDSPYTSVEITVVFPPDPYASQLEPVHTIADAADENPEATAVHVIPSALIAIVVLPVPTATKVYPFQAIS